MRLRTDLSIGTVVKTPKRPIGTVVKPPETPNGTVVNPPQTLIGTVVNPPKPAIGTDCLRSLGGRRVRATFYPAPS
jgi:hypothetical protein